MYHSFLNNLYNLIPSINNMTNAAKPIKPVRKLKLVFTTAKNTMANKKIVATSFQILNCVDVNENIPSCCCLKT